jgi:putative addiction module killer protein
MQYAIEQTEEFEAWLDGLADPIAREAVAARMIRASLGNFGDHASIGNGVSEMRIHYGPGYRAYYTVRGRAVVFMLLGGTKRTQKRDIRDAQDMADDLE